MRRRLGDLQGALRQIERGVPTRLGQPVRRRRGRGERDVGAHPAQPGLQDRHHAGLMIDQGGRGPGGLRCRGQPGHPSGERGAHRDDVHRRRGERHQNRQRIARIGERRRERCGIRPRRNQVGGKGGNRRSHLAKTAVVVDVVVQFDHQATQRALDMGLGNPRDPANGSSTTAEYSCQRGNGSNGSRSRCTRRPLCQRTGGRMFSRVPSVELLIPSARPVELATDCTTGPANSATGLANSWTAPAAPAAVGHACSH